MTGEWGAGFVARWDQTRDRPAAIGDHDLTALAHLLEEGREVLSRFADSR